MKCASLTLSFLRLNLQLCLVVYFIYILNYPGSESAGIRQDQAKSTENPNIDNSSLDHATRKIKLAQGGDGVNVESDENRKKEASTEARSSKPPYVELWKGLYQRHWPQLLDCYNISLLGRYIFVLLILQTFVEFVFFISRTTDSP